jgi:hypothetical protein
MTTILLLDPNRWPSQTADPAAGLRIRRSIVAANPDLSAAWVLMEDDHTPGDNIQKFLSLASKSSHVFLIWPVDCKMVGTQDELILWQAIKELREAAPECYLFHQVGVLEVRTDTEQCVQMKDHQGKSPYLFDILKRGVFLPEWQDLPDLHRQVRAVLVSDVGVGRR